MDKTLTGGRTRRRRKSRGATGVVDCPEPLLPVLELERFEPVGRASGGTRDKSGGSTCFAMLGSGQCGGRLVKTFYDLGYCKGLAVNTTHKDLDLLGLPADQKFLMDIGAEGAGKDMVRGREAINAYRQKILHKCGEVFGSDVDHIMVCFGAGGGTGSGSARSLVELAQSYVRHTGSKNPQKSVGVIMTLPTDGEARSTSVAHNAYTIASELSLMAWQGKISPLIIVDNNKIAKMQPGLTVKEYWPTINGTVGSLFHEFNRLSSRPSEYTSFDPTDYYSIISTGGCAIMGLTEVEDYRDRYSISRAIKNNLHETLLADNFDLSRARVAGSIVVGDRKIMADVPGLQDNINYGFDVLADITGRATIHRGIYEDDNQTLRVYTIIGGLPAPIRRLEEMRY